MIGADPEELRALAKLFTKYSSALNQTSNDLTPTIMRARWNGADAQRFRQDWTSRLRPHIRNAADLFTDTSQKLQAQAKEQEQASSVASLGAGDGGGADSGGANTGSHTPSGLQKDLEDMANRSDEEVKAWWDGLSEEEKQQLLEGQDENGIPNAYYLAALEDKLPAEDQDVIREFLVERAKGNIPMYTQTDKIGVDGQIAWVHGGAHISSTIVQNADGTATLKVAGDISGGANTPSTKAGADVTLSGELSRTYTFDSADEARAAREQMLNDLPPDSLGSAKDAIGNPGKYIENTLDDAAKQHGSTDDSTSVKGTLSLGLKGGLSDDVSAEARLDLAYEQNLSDGTSKATVTAKVKADLDMGQDMSFGGNGEAGVKLSMDADGDIQKMQIDLKGTLKSGLSAQDNPNPQDPFAELLGTAQVKEGPSASTSAGVQGTMSMELQYTPENRHLIDSYLSNIASGNNQAAASDLQQIYHASGVTIQANTVASGESNFVDFDSGVASLKVGASTETTTNAGTLHKSPYDDGYHSIQGANRAQVNQ